MKLLRIVFRTLLPELKFHAHEKDDNSKGEHSTKFCHDRAATKEQDIKHKIYKEGSTKEEKLRMLETIIETGTISIIAVCWINYLVHEGGIFDFLRFFFRDRLHAHHKIMKVLFDCEMCFAGQLSFWYFLICNFYDYNIIDHIAFVFYSIFGAAILVKILYE